MFKQDTFFFLNWKNDFYVNIHMLVYSEVAHHVQHVIHFVLGSDIILEGEENLCFLYIY